MEIALCQDYVFSCSPMLQQYMITVHIFMQNLDSNAIHESSSPAGSL